MKSTNYFQNFNKTINYGIVITNLLNRAEVNTTSLITNSKLYTPYLIKDGETPESIAEVYYGNTSYFWIILYANNIRNIYEDWPRTQHEFDNFMEDKYYSLEYALSAIHHYEDSDGDWISQYDVDTGIKSASTAVTIYDYENNLNEEKRRINIINVAYKTQLIREFQQIFK